MYSDIRVMEKEYVMIKRTKHTLFLMIPKSFKESRTRLIDRHANIIIVNCQMYESPFSCTVL